ncbi:hypothetical protein DKX38_004759 [Salix brachista]|uniref:Uncharacterized protein n=1 Tax=Salix brachista TaxID=2182728 RepID=A0A5N5NAV4_9ROSI|nr:hypothetical protein DKX38_004759 [Salix brachista]
MERRFLKLRKPESVNEGCSKFVRYRRRAITMKRFQVSTLRIRTCHYICRFKLSFKTGSKSKQNRKQKANMESFKEDMKKISEQQQRIKDGQMEVRRSFEEIESQCDQLNKEPSLIWRQTLYNQQRICLIFKILKAREDNNFSMVAELTQFLRLSLSPSFIFVA